MPRNEFKIPLDIAAMEMSEVETNITNAVAG